MESVNKKNPAFDIQEQPAMDVKEISQKEDALTLRKVPQAGRAETMGKMNILEWVKNNMPDELSENKIVDIKPRKMIDESGAAQWKLIDMKDPHDPKGGSKTYLQIQTFWIIKTDDGKERVATQYLISGVEWPKENSAEQLEAVRRATLAIDLYTHTMARPLFKKDSDLPEGFRFQDLIGVHQLTVSIEAKGPLKDRIKVVISTPSGQGIGSRSLKYTLVQKVDSVARTILGSEVDLNKIDREARGAVVREAGGRHVNPHEREAYAMETQLNKMYVNGKGIDEEFAADLQDPTKRDQLLHFMDKERERHVVDFNRAHRTMFNGPQTATGVRLAHVRNALSMVLPFKISSTQQQRLQKHLDHKEEVGKLDEQVEKQRNKVVELEEKINHSEGLERSSYENQYKSASDELGQIIGEQQDHHRLLNDDRQMLDNLLFRMEGAYDFLSAKEPQHRDLAYFLTQKAYVEAGHKLNAKKPLTLNQMLVAKGVKEKLTPAEDHFVNAYQKMIKKNYMMQKTIDEVQNKLGLEPRDGYLGVEFEEILEEEDRSDMLIPENDDL
jgi:hypothetical protein